MTRFHEQLKAPTTDDHDAITMLACKLDFAKVFFKAKFGEPRIEVMVREQLRGAPLGYVDILVPYEIKKEGRKGNLAIEVKPNASGLVNAIRQLNTYKWSWTITPSI